jgi:chlorite dismutase
MISVLDRKKQTLPTSAPNERACDLVQPEDMRELEMPKEKSQASNDLHTVSNQAHASKPEKGGVENDNSGLDALMISSSNTMEELQEHERNFEKMFMNLSMSTVRTRVC